MKFSASIVSAASLVGLLALYSPSCQAFAPIQPSARVTSSLSVSLPRVDLPSAVTEKLDEFDLKDPNLMTESEYQSYAGAAILGTLGCFVLPGAFLTGFYSTVGSILGVVVLDFVLSALIGGGALIYLSLRDDEIGATVRKYGGDLLGKAKDATGISTLRYDLPEAATDVMVGQLGLLNPNDMDEAAYDGYSGAAVVGTLAFFLLPGAAVTGAGDVLGQFFAGVLFNFIVSALLGGGAFIYLSLRKDEIGNTVNQAGTKLLDTVDDLLA